MNTPNTHSGLPEPLTPEERALAAQLAQLGPHGMPAPALDARIIAAARAVGDAQTRSPHGRWPALLGLAATLAIAVGVTWQMQPGGVKMAPDDGAARERAPAVATQAPAGTAEPTAAPAAKQQPLARNEEAAAMPTPGPAAAEPDQAAAAAPGRATAAASAAPAPPPPAQPQPPLVAAPPASPPAPLIGQPAIEAAAPARAPPEPTVRRMESHAESMPASAPMERAMADTGAAAIAGGDLAAVPVARDGELEPEDWIERIRQRRDAGDLAGARDSLALLRRAHPQTVLPDDLHELAANQLDPP